METIDIKYYGRQITKVPNTNACGLSEIPGEDATEYEVFMDLKSFLLSTDLKDKINIEFIDINDEKISNSHINEILEKYETPIISIMDKEFLIGKEHNVNVFMKIKKHLK